MSAALSAGPQPKGALWAAASPSAPQKPKQDVLLALMQCPDELIKACLSQLRNGELTYFVGNLHKAWLPGHDSRDFATLRLAANAVCSSRIRFQDGLKLPGRDALTVMGRHWPKEQHKVWFDTLLQREHLRASCATMHAFLVDEDPIYFKMSQRSSASEFKGIAPANTLMLEAFSTLASVQSQQARKVLPKTATQSHAAWREAATQPHPFAAAGQRALMLWSLLPAKDRATTLGLLVHGTAVTFLGEPKRALQSFAAARRAHLQHLRMPAYDRMLPQYFASAHTELTLAQGNHWDHEQNTPQLGLLRQAALMSGSPQLVHYCIFWRNEELKVRSARHWDSELLQQDLQHFVVAGQNSALTAALAAEPEKWRGRKWLRDTVTDLASFEAEMNSSSGAGLPRENKFRQHLRATRRILEPYAQRVDEPF